MPFSWTPSRAATVLVVAHDRGSSPPSVARALARACAAADLELLTWPSPDGAGVDEVAAALGQLAESAGARVVGGIGAGASAALLWAAGRQLDGVVAVLPPRAADASPAPGTLARVGAPTGLVAYADGRDGGVAAAWAQDLPTAHVEHVDAADIVRDPAALGDAAVRAWLLARQAARAETAR